MPTLICDLDGVVYLGETEIPGSGKALVRFSVAGWNILFCTNNATRTPVQGAEKIRRVTGFAADPAGIVTSAQAAATLLDPTSIVFVLGGEGLRVAVAERGCSISADWREVTDVVVGLDPELSYDRLSSAVLAIGRGARFVASNHDATYPTPDGLAPGAGAIVAAVSRATGREPVVAGKPHEAMRKLLAAKTEGEVWIVGDRDDTDLEMGRLEGWSTAHVTTGVSAAASEAPTLAVADLAAVADHLLA
jgi:HAD superfamily hydrolase (TIGR01450 family)